MARQGPELRRDGESAGGAWAQERHRLRRSAEEGEGVSERSGRHACGQDAELLARLLVEQHYPDESEDGAHAQGLRAVAAESRRRRAGRLPRARHLRLDHDQRLLLRQARTQGPLDQHGHRRAVGDCSGRRDWRGKGSCRYSGRTERSPRHAIWTRFESRFATAIST